MSEDVRQPPYHTEAEQAVLGAMVTDLTGQAALRAIELLEDWMFFREGHRRLFKVLMAIARRAEPIDPVTLRAELETKGQLESVGGVDYLAYLLDVVPTAANLEHHARIVREKALLRRVIEVGTAMVQEAYEGRTASPAILGHAEAALMSVAQDQSGAGLVRIRKMIFAAIERMEALHGAGGGVVTGVPSGFKDLDERTAGFQPSDLVIVAARPSMGKTAFCLNVAQHVAIEKGQGVAIFSLEMSAASLMGRLLTSEARVDAHRVRTGSLRDSDYKLMASAAGLLSGAPIWIDDSAGLTPLELRARARRHAAEEPGLGLVIVDYIQLMREPEYRDNRNLEIGAITRSLKALAKELRVPVMALSQLSRAPEQRPRKDRRPQLADLRESGSIEQDADVVLFLYRPEMYAKDEAEREELHGRAEVIIGKQRNGPTGTVKLYFHQQYTRFDNYTEREGERGEQQEIDVLSLRRPVRTGGGDE